MRRAYFKNTWYVIMLASVLMISVVSTRILDIHLAERNWLIKKDEFLNGSANYLYAIWKFQSSRALHQNEINQEEYDRQIFESHYLMNLSPEDIEPFKSANLFDYASLETINLIRFIANKDPLPDFEEATFIYKLFGAVYLIINRQYEEAKVVLNKLLLTPQGQAYTDQILLHIGFCNSILGQTEASLESFQQIIDRYQNSPKASQARRLKFEVQTRISALEKLQNPGIEDLHSLAIMNSCQQVLSHQVSGLSKSKRSLVYYAQGVCHWESGDKTQAVDKLQRSLLNSTNVDKAKEANRSLYILSQNESELEQSQALSLKLNQILQDSTMLLLDKIKEKNPINLNLVKAHTQTLLEEFDMNTQVESPQVQSVSEKSIIKNIQRIQGRKVPPPQKRSSHRIGVHSRVKITTQQGRSFQGKLLNAPNSSILKLKTLVGVMRIPQSQIKSMSALKP